jgi:hypothetical protein
LGVMQCKTTLMAKWFASQGYGVSFLTWDEGGPPQEYIDGVRVIKVCRQNAGIAGLRFFHPKWSGLVRAMREANADLYYQNGSECTTGQVALWCRWNGKSFVFCLASDADCNPALPELSRHDRMLYRTGLRRADRRVVQTLTQAGRLREVFAVDSVVIPMPCPEPPAEPALTAPQSTRAILWVGRVCQVKRPERLLELARLCPELAFDLVGPFTDQDSEKNWRDRANGIANLKLHGGIPRERIHGFYRRASMLCCTSEYEGFPNTVCRWFQLWIPTASLPDIISGWWFPTFHKWDRPSAPWSIRRRATRRCLGMPEITLHGIITRPRSCRSLNRCFWKRLPTVLSATTLPTNFTANPEAPVKKSPL